MSSQSEAKRSAVQTRGESCDVVPTDSHVPVAGEDVAAAYAARFNGEDAYTRKEEKRLRWKIDLRLVPILWFNITLGAMDKGSTSTAALYGMREATGSTGNKYNWVGSAFYFGYLLWCFPAGSLLQKLPVAKTMFVAQFVWGIILISTAYARNFPTLIALRVLLGVLEAPIMPGNYLILNMWYTRHEQSLRSGLMYTNLSSFFTGPIGYGIGFIGGDPWGWFFIITGAITVVWACVVGLFLPDSPVSAKFISEREKAIAIERLRSNQTGIENKTFKREQMIETFKDPKTWLMFWFNIFCSVPNGGLTNFQSLIIKGLGYSSQSAVLLTMPEGAVGTASCYICCGAVFLMIKHYPKLQVRTAVIVCGELIGLIACVFLYTLPLSNNKGRLAALWMAKFFLGPYVVSLALNTANTAGHTKRVVTGAIIFISYCLSNIIAPQFFKASQAPLYPLGMGAMLCSYGLSIFIICLYALYCWNENGRRDRIDAAGGERVHMDTDFKDLTDKQNIHFRYVW